MSDVLDALRDALENVYVIIILGIVIVIVVFVLWWVLTNLHP
jgi:heme/copper-type cytochrome/quinol oxidase subunit 4